MKTLTILTALLICAFSSIAQSPDAFNYQAVARDAGGAVLANTNIALRFSIRDVTAGGTILYRERQTALTNQFGLFTCVLGTGTVLSGTFATINWAVDNKFLQVELDPAGGTTYINMSTTQLLSVPYAKVAEVINMFPGGVSNPDKMVISHSSAYPDYGLQYQDATDKFNFLSNNNPVLTIDLSASRNVGVGTASPASPLDVRGSKPARADTGLITVSNTGTGNAICAIGAGTAFSSGAVISAENTNSGNAVAGVTSGSGYAIYGYNSTGPAAHFTGDVENVGDVSTTGFTNLGSTAPSIKMKTITGTTNANQGGIANIAHGLTASKILSVNILVEYQPGLYLPPSGFSAGNEYTYIINALNISIVNHPSNSGNVLSAPVKVLVVYEQ